VKAFQLLHSLVIFERLVGERRFNVAHRAPDARRNVELTDFSQFLQRLKIFRVGDGAVHVHHHDPKIAARQRERIRDWRVDTVHHHLPSEAQDP
jgi:hypothetical protein